MTKEEAKTELRKAESYLRQANVVLEMHEEGIKEIEDEIAELQAIINKPDRWQDGLVQPAKEEFFYLINTEYEGQTVSWSSKSKRKPEHSFKTKEQAELIKDKILLMQEMHAFAHVRNEDWMPDWQDDEHVMYGIIHRRDDIWVDCFAYANSFVFGITVKSREIAEEMLKMFGERIEKFYNKMY